MRRLIFTIFHSMGIPVILRKCRVNKREIAVLMFHRVSDEPDPLWPAMSVEIFKFLIKELVKKTYIFPLQNIEAIKQYPGKPLVALSFDDGYIDFWENVLPVLVDFKLPAHHNICPALIDKGLPPWTQVLNKFLQYNSSRVIELPDGRMYKTRRQEFREADFINICNGLYEVSDETRGDWVNSLIARIPEHKITKPMSWEQIKDCARLGIHIGSHGMTHRIMSKVKDENILLTEIRDSRERICKEVGIPPLIFAFPNGMHDPRSIRAVKNSGYKIALICDDMVSRFDNAASRSFYMFPRINICRSSWEEEILRSLGFHQKLKGFFTQTPYVFQS